MNIDPLARKVRFQDKVFTVVFAAMVTTLLTFGLYMVRDYITDVRDHEHRIESLETNSVLDSKQMELLQKEIDATQKSLEAMRQHAANLEEQNKIIIDQNAKLLTITMDIQKRMGRAK